MNKESKVRFFNNVVESKSMDIYINKKPYLLNLSYKDYTDYLSLGENIYKVIFVENKKKKCISIILKSFNKYTFVITGNLDSLKILGFKDDNRCPRPGNASLRFIHGAFEVPNVNVYLNEEKVFDNIEFGKTENPPYAETSVSNKNVITVKTVEDDKTVLGPVELFLKNGDIHTIIASGGTKNVDISAIISTDNRDYDCELLKQGFIPEKYMGKWYQISDFPKYYEKDCTYSSAEYTLLKDKIKVINKCYDKNRKVIRYVEGFAKNTNPMIRQALRVEFPNENIPSEFTSNIQGDNYLIHDTDYYTYSLVGSPDRNSLYILSRTPTMDIKLYEKLLKLSKDAGYDINRLVLVPCNLSS